MMAAGWRYFFLTTLEHDEAYRTNLQVLFKLWMLNLVWSNSLPVQVCTLRPVAGVEEFFDTDNPDVFVYKAN